MAAAGKLERHHIEPLMQLTNSGFCMHRSWGFGRIKTVDTVFARFTIDFHEQGRATRWIWRLPPNRSSRFPRTTSWRARPPTSKACARWPPRNHLDLIKLVLNSLRRQGDGGPDPAGARARCHPRRLEEMVGNGAKREMKKDGHFLVPLKKTEPIIYQVQGNVAAGPAAGGFPRGQRA